MRKVICILLVVASVCGCRTQPPAKVSGQRSADEILRSYGGLEVSCTPLYYRRASDSALISAEDAEAQDDFNASGVVLRIESPESEAGKVLSFHFDFPDKWDHWYKPGHSYAGMVEKGLLGRMNFMCDPGLREVAGKRKAN